MSTEIKKSEFDAAAKAVRRRSIAIALMLGLMAVLFYATAIIRVGATLTKVS